MSAAAFPHVLVAGGPFERGRQHGAQAGDLIAYHLRRLTAALGQPQPGAAGPLSREHLLARALRFLPAYERFAPDLVEEIRGVAAGARISFAEALLLNVRGEVLGVADEGCTAFAVGCSLTADGGVLAGQNSDQAAWNLEVMVVLSVRPDHGPPALLCTHAGLIGYHGCNAAGVGQFANAVPASGRRGRGMPHYLMKRRLLAQASVDDCLAVMRQVMVASPGNYVLADRGGRLLDVELTTEAVETLAPQGDMIVHANHYEHPRLHAYNAAMKRLSGSAGRAARLAALIGRQAGRVTVASMQAALADQASQPEAICSDDGSHGMTVASLVAEVDHGRLHVARGGAARGRFAVYSAP